MGRSSMATSFGPGDQSIPAYTPDSSETEGDELPQRNEISADKETEDDTEEDTGENERPPLPSKKRKSAQNPGQASSQTYYGIKNVTLAGSGHNLIGSFIRHENHYYTQEDKSSKSSTERQRKRRRMSRERQHRANTESHKKTPPTMSGAVPPTEAERVPDSDCFITHCFKKTHDRSVKPGKERSAPPKAPPQREPHDSISSDKSDSKGPLPLRLAGPANPPEYSGTPVRRKARDENDSHASETDDSDAGSRRIDHRKPEGSGKSTMARTRAASARLTRSKASSGVHDD